MEFLKTEKVSYTYILKRRGVGHPEIEKNSRRDFLKGAAVLAAAAVTACSPKDPFTAAGENATQASGEKVKLLSVTGEIIEVDKAYLKPVPEAPHVSNEEARKGMPGK